MFKNLIKKLNQETENAKTPEDIAKLIKSRKTKSKFALILAIFGIALGIGCFIAFTILLMEAEGPQDILVPFILIMPSSLITAIGFRLFFILRITTNTDSNK